MVNLRRDLLKLKIELIGILSLIWREIRVPARYSFWDLHVAIQDAMGWEDDHLHEFRVRDRAQGAQVLIGIVTQGTFTYFAEMLAG